MKKRIINLMTLVVFSTLLLNGCGNKEVSSIEPSETQEALDKSESIEEIESETQELEDVVLESEAQELEEVVLESETQEKETLTTKDTKNANVEKVAPSESQSVSESSSNEPTQNTPTSETTSNVPSSGDIIYNGSVNLPSLGISIVCPNQYVSSGFSYNDILNNANAFTNALNNKYGTNAQGMTWNGNAYGFYTLGYNSTPNSQIKYNGDGTYTLIIGAHFGGGYQYTLGQYDITSLNADAILCELATMSSTPQSVYNGVYDILYGTTIYDANTWYTFGDCKVSYSPEGNDDPMDATIYLKKA